MMTPTGEATSRETPPSPLLSVEDLSVTFATARGPLRAVDDVSLQVSRGQTLGIVGESGSGKTVLSRSIIGLGRRKKISRTGRIVFEGREISSLGRKETRHLRGVQIGMVFQDPMTSLNPVMKIGEQITETLITHKKGLRKAEAREMAVYLLRSVGMSEPAARLSQYPFELSGGMRQRVTIAIAISCGPKLLLADEPTTALDVTVQAQILKLLREEQRSRHMGMILVTHDLGVVANHTDYVAVMYAGRIVERAPTATLFTEMRMPYTEALLKSIPRLDEASHTPLHSIEGRPPDLTELQPGCRFAPRCDYAQERCWEEEPMLTTDGSVSAEHEFACFYPVGVSWPRRRASKAGQVGE